ncbi:MAG TPA: PQQ-binding-like beta-propeller repeat protein [Solirubrobacteraceae bacterium]|nr:PQQ-binding-like beta-propeller repeat protein [Solirubrobacteraceae bacterium]
MRSLRFAPRRLILALVLLTCAPAVARADWTTYRGDSARSGVDASSIGSVPFGAAWTSRSLGGAIWGEPLVHDGLVVVATESDQVAALSESTGQLVWQTSAGTPVPSSGSGPHPPCGDISPTVGITSTPVIDPATDQVFVVADNLIGSSIQHRLYAFNLSNGSAVSGFPMDVEPPGDVPADQLQRPALAIDNGQIIIGYGGNDGDCGTYHGWLVAVPETGGPLHTFEVDSTATQGQGAIWGAGNGPAIDSAGDVWVSTGNGNTGSSFDYQESVLKLDSSMTLLDHWAPSNWQSLDSGDVDLGSSAPALLPNGLVFEIGKQGLGYLLSASHLGGTGASPAYQGQVCSGSWGGAIYYNGIIYVTCSSGLRALALNATAPSFSAVGAWQVNSAINGPPIVAGGLVWATDWNSGTLYGLNPQTGQAVVKQTTPAMEHFTTPAASDGKLFLATGSTVEAYTIANPVSSSAPPAPPPPPPPPPPTCVLKLRSGVKLHYPKPHGHHKHPPPAFGTVRLVATCSEDAGVALRGVVTEHLGKKHRRGKARTRAFHLVKVTSTVTGGVARTLQLRVGPTLLRALARRIRTSGSFSLTATNPDGTARAVAGGRLRL